MDELWSSLADRLTTAGLETLYLVCAALGGGAFLVQLGLSLFGVADDVDVDVDTDVGDGHHNGAFGVLSVRAVAGFLLFFGLVGWAGTASGWSTPVAALGAAGAGGAAMLLIAWVMSLFRRLTEEGTVDPAEAVGKTARVYLRIPAERGGRGKITVSLRGRSIELQAQTAGAALPTGAACRVVSRIDSDLFEVEALGAGP